MLYLVTFLCIASLYLVNYVHLIFKPRENRKIFRAHLHQVSDSVWHQCCDDTCKTVLIDHSGDTWESDCNPLWSNSIVISENWVASIITALTPNWLTLGVNGPLAGIYLRVLYLYDLWTEMKGFCGESIVSLWWKLLIVMSGK